MATNEKNKGTDQVEESRRKFLKSASKIAVYTPPAMLVMSKPSYATFKGTGGQVSHFDFQGAIERRRRLPRRRWYHHFFGNY